MMRKIPFLRCLVWAGCLVIALAVLAGCAAPAATPAVQTQPVAGQPSAAAMPTQPVQKTIGATSIAPATAGPQPGAPTQAPVVQPGAEGTSAGPTSAPTQAGVQPVPTATRPVESTFPAPTSLPTQIIEKPTGIVEARVVELEWPSSLRLGDSDVVRLSLIPSKDGYTVTTEYPEHLVQSQDVPINRPGGYDLQALARLDGVGFEISPGAEQAGYLPQGETVTWRWSLTPRSPGQQRLSISLRIRWIPQPGVQGSLRESLAYSRSLDVQVRSFFGMTRGQAMTTGFLGLIFGGGLGLFALLPFVLPRRSGLQSWQPNPSLTLEPYPGMKLSADEKALLQSLFNRYGRLSLQGEFLSGYSGARTFLALPIRADGRADAATIIKIGSAESIRQEYRNYEEFVKDTLPPVTARIQHPPVTTPGLARSYQKSSGRQGRAAIQYTFIGRPGHTPVSLRQALLANPDPSYLQTLFETFGPNWWMQRRPYSFRLCQEYDRMLPAHLVIEPASGRGKGLDGGASPYELNLQVGDPVTLRHFPFVEVRVDGQSLALRGEPAPGLPALRLRWNGLSDPNGASGRVAATRLSILQEMAAGYDRCGLADPLERLPDLLNEMVAGSQSIIHGDLNLENILIGPGGFVWLIDFAQTREGHPLYDFAHLEAELVAHIISPRLDSPEQIIQALRSPEASPFGPLLEALHGVAARCLFNPDQPREYHLSRWIAFLGALKFVNLDARQRQALYLAAAEVLTDSLG